MKNFTRIVFSSLLFFATLLQLSSLTMAQGVQDFVINNFDATYELTNDDPQGFLEVTESIDLTYSAQNRGILRALPNSYKGNDLNLKVIGVSRDGQQEPYITYQESDNTVLRIGDVNVYITGEHSYTITYQMENVITFYDEYDEFFWDVNGDQWLQPFESVSAAIVTRGEKSATQKPGCFTGNFGSTEQNCEFTAPAGNLTATTTQTLGPGETLTVLVGFEKGYFTPPSWFEQNWQYLATIPVLLLQIVIIRRAHKVWVQYGKDVHAKGVVAPYFGRPKNVSVLQASYVAENKLAPKHLSATIIDLAIRGYLQINETGSGKKLKHELVILKPQDDQTTVHEKKLIKELFGTTAVGSTVKIEDKKQKLSSTMKELSSNMDELTHDKGYYELSPKNAAKKQIMNIVFAVLLLIVGFISLGVLENAVLLICGIVTLLVVIIYTVLMPKRSQSGEELKSHMEGLKLYLGFSEKDRLAAQDAVEAPLANNAAQPERTREFFEKLLPFAIAMGVEKSWSKAFSDIYQEPPDWYRGNWSTFTTAALVSSLSDTVSATTQSFSAPSSSGSSGFSGGGFSGGGGGGGGGGGW